MSETAPTYNVGFLLYNGCTLVDFAGATQIFGFAANFENYWIAREKGPIRTTENIEVMASYSLDDHPELDILFIPGGGADGVVASMDDDILIDWVKRTAQGKWAGSVCSGAFIAAVAGLFDGMSATTHWEVLRQLAKFPEIAVDVNSYPRFLVHEDKQRFSGGGVSSSLDLALELVTVIESQYAAERTQLSNQYAPDPPVSAGDPSEAPPALVAEVYEDNLETFIMPIDEAVERHITDA